MRLKRRALTWWLVLLLVAAGSPAGAVASVYAIRPSTLLHGACNPPPTQRECDSAMKILREFERLADKYHVKISKKRLKELRRKLREGTITVFDLPAKLRRNYPRYFYDPQRPWTLNDIEEACKVAV